MNHSRQRRHPVAYLAGLMLLLSLLAVVPAASGASVPPGIDTVAALQEPRQTTPELIDQALADGQISAEQRLLYLAYAVYEYSSLPVQFHSNAGWHGTATVQEVRSAWQAANLEQITLPPAIYSELDRLLAPADATICDQEDGPNNDSSSATFYINYNVIHDPVLTLADYRQALDDTFAIEVTSYGWAKPPLCTAGTGTCPPPDNKYPVQIANLGGGLYGYVTTDGDYGGWIVGDNPNTTDVETDSTTSCMVLNDDYTNNGLGGLAGLQVTAAHEYVHAIQNGYGDPDPREDSLWWESIAAYMEDEVLDASNDNYQYLWPLWSESLGAWPEANHYANWILYRYAAEHNGGTNLAGGGEDVIQDIWRGIAAGKWGVVAFNDALAAKTSGATLADTFHKFAIASRFLMSCPHSDPYCYEEANGYFSAAGGPANTGSIGAIPGSYNGSILDNYAINWVGLPTSGGPYNVTLSNTAAGGQLRASVVADPNGDGTGTLDVQALPTVVNAGESRSLCYSPPGAPDSVVAVITNQAQSASDPVVANLDSYDLALTAASNTGSLSNLPVGATVDIGCGTFVKAQRNSGDPGTVAATKNVGAPVGNPPGPNAIPVTWDITASGGTFAVDLSLCYTDAELTASGASENTLVLFRSTDAGATWTAVGADARDAAANCVTKNGVTAFSRWALAPAAPTAVVLADFGAAPVDGAIQVTWETTSELDNAGFNLYRADDAAGPQTLLATVPSQGPGSAQGFVYSYDDLAVQPGQAYWYWLEDVSLSGATTLHGPVSATASAPTAVTLTEIDTQGARLPVNPWWAAVISVLLLAGAGFWRRRQARVI